MDIQISQSYLKKLRLRYNKAEKDKEESFVFNGSEFLTTYCKYFLEYYESLFKIK